MAISTAQVTAGATEAALNTADADSWITLTVRNSHATDALYVGPTGVTTSNGFGIAAGGVVKFELTPGAVLYGLRGSSNDITAHVFRSIN
jgi:hypothetical protein